MGELPVYAKPCNKCKKPIGVNVTVLEEFELEVSPKGYSQSYPKIYYHKSCMKARIFRLYNWLRRR